MFYKVYENKKWLGERNHKHVLPIKCGRIKNEYKKETISKVYFIKQVRVKRKDRIRIC